jgi:hypothetical protein
MKSVLALAAVAAIGFSGTVFAQEAAKPAAMSDAEMDRITAGGATVDHPPIPGSGVTVNLPVTSNRQRGWANNNHNTGNGQAANHAATLVLGAP